MQPGSVASTGGSAGTVVAPAPTCPSCGAPLPLDFMRPKLECRHCGAALAVDKELRRAMRGYVGDVAEAARKELRARFDAAFYAQNEKAASAIVLGTIGIAIALTGAFVAWSITRSLQIPLAMPYFDVLIVAWIASLAAFARGWWVMYALPSPRLLAAIRAVSCSTCGATSTLSAGEAARRCRHCEGTVLVPSELAVSLLDESRARESASRASEQAALESAVDAGNRYVTPAIIIVFIAVIGGMGAVLFFGRISDDGISGTELWLAFGALFAIAFAFMWQGTARGLRARRALDAQIAELARRVASSAGSI